MNHDQILADRNLLAFTFPKCFVPKGMPKKALKVHIHKDIRDRLEIPALRLHDVLHDYCSGARYQKALLADDSRIDLDGEIAGVVDAAAKGHATVALRRINGEARLRAKIKLLQAENAGLKHELEMRTLASSFDI